MREFAKPFLLAGIFFFFASALVSAEVVDNFLGSALLSIFPELKSGYIDLNGNGKEDRSDELDEAVPDSIVRDQLLQTQEVLDFLIGNYRYVPLDRLRKIRAALDRPEGAISEIIALRYARLVDDAITKRAELGDELLFLTPTAYQEAVSLMEERAASLAAAYRKEKSDAEKEFVRIEDELFSLLERGYPVPGSIAPEDRTVLVSSLINTLITKKSSDPQRVVTAVRTLGKLKADDAVPFLSDLIASPQYKKEVVKTLGMIGGRDILPVLLKELDAENPADVRNALVTALGNIGGSESRERLLSLLDAAKTAGEREQLKAVMNALVSLAETGSADARVFSVFKEALSDESAEIRMIAVRGSAFFPRSGAADLLIPLLTRETDRDTLIEIIRALNRLGNSNAMRSFITLLRDQETDDAVRVELLSAIGGSRDGVSVLQNVLGYLGSPNKAVREAASNAVVSLHAQNAQAVTGGLARVLVTGTDEQLLTEGSAVLARLADPASAGFLLQLLQKPFPAVKKNITWALYRIGTLSDARIVEELRNLVTSETEPLSVRINAVRALGAFRYDSAQLKVWQTLLTIAKIRGEKYGMLRYFAVRALGSLAPDEPEVYSTLTLLATKDPDLEIRKEAADALKRFARSGEGTAETLIRAFRKESDTELKVRILETLGDMGAGGLRDLALPLLGRQQLDSSVKKRILYALYRVGKEEELSAILDAAKDDALRDYIAGFLEDADAAVLGPIISRRLKTETDPGVLQVLESLETRFSERF